MWYIRYITFKKLHVDINLRRWDRHRRKLKWPLAEELQEDEGRSELRWTRWVYWWRLLLSVSSFVVWKAKLFSKEEKQNKIVRETKTKEDIWMAMPRGKK